MIEFGTLSTPSNIAWVTSGWYLFRTIICFLLCFSSESVVQQFRITYYVRRSKKVYRLLLNWKKLFLSLNGIHNTCLFKDFKSKETLFIKSNHLQLVGHKNLWQFTDVFFCSRSSAMYESFNQSCIHVRHCCVTNMLTTHTDYSWFSGLHEFCSK